MIKPPGLTPTAGAFYFKPPGLTQFTGAFYLKPSGLTPFTGAFYLKPSGLTQFTGAFYFKPPGLAQFTGAFCFKPPGLAQITGVFGFKPPGLAQFTGAFCFKPPGLAQITGVFGFSHAVCPFSQAGKPAKHPVGKNSGEENKKTGCRMMDVESHRATARPFTFHFLVHVHLLSRVTDPDNIHALRQGDRRLTCWRRDRADEHTVEVYRHLPARPSGESDKAFHPQHKCAPRGGRHYPRYSR